MIGFIVFPFFDQLNKNFLTKVSQVTLPKRKNRLKAFVLCKKNVYQN